MTRRTRIAGVLLLAAWASAAGGAAHAGPGELRPVLQKLLTEYRDCNVDEGVGKRDVDRCLDAGNRCTLASRQSGFAQLQAAANAGNDTGFSASLQRVLLNDCFKCAKHGKWHTKQGHCTLDCGGNNDFQNGWHPGRGACFEGCKAGVDLTRWAGDLGRAIGLAIGSAKPAEAVDTVVGGSIASNQRLLFPVKVLLAPGKDNALPDETCSTQQTSVNGRPPAAFDLDYPAPPERLLDWTATTGSPFRITLIDSLKALVVGMLSVGAAISGLLAPFVPAVAGGAAALAGNGLPSSLIGLPLGKSPQLQDFKSSWRENVGANEGRLRADLREAARLASPVESLARATMYFARGDEPNGKAFAELSVTGRLAFERFRRSPPTEAQVLAAFRTVAPATAALPSAALSRAARTALARAYRVASVVRGGGLCAVERRKLGWLAVSGEDDQPHRPVNVSSAPFPQYDLKVALKSRYYPGRPELEVDTRYIIAHTTPPTRPAACAPSDVKLPVEPTPVLAPDAKVLLFVHGMDSRLEEALDLVNALQGVGGSAKPSPLRQNWTVVSVDLPTSGYATNLDHSRISPLDATGEAKFRFHGAADLELTDLQLFDARGKHEAPVLDFIEDFILAFVDRLDAKLGGTLKPRLMAVIGGSLGGNMSMRLGRQPRATWLKNVVPWSPAAIWPSYADGADPTKHIAVAMPWMWAGGDPRQKAESAADRREFFYRAFDWTMGLLKRKPQAQEWYRGGWPCKPFHLTSSRLERQETYNPLFRLWHWRLGFEQLLFSQQIGAKGHELYLENTKRMLLLCGVEDTGGDLCKHVRDVAPKMTRTPGKALYLEATGHSIHTERPAWLARELTEFLCATPGACPPTR